MPTNDELKELIKVPEVRAEMARLQAKTTIHHDSLVAEAIREAVRQERKDIEEWLGTLHKDCICTTQLVPPEESPCQVCLEIARIQGGIMGRPER
jgi:hypothetical protein